MLQDKVFYILRPHPRKLQIVFFGTGVVGEPRKHGKCIGIILKEFSKHFQSVMTIGRNLYPIKFKRDVFGLDTISKTISLKVLAL